MKMSDQDERYLLAQISKGEAVLVLGAGASVTSRNRKGAPVKMAGALAELFAKEGGSDYQGEKLSEVLDALRGEYLSDSKIKSLLTAEYRGITPSHELEDLLFISWYRLYTWNIDDSLENMKSSSIAQRMRFYNGMTDKVIEHEGPLYLQTVYLHGQITKPDARFILTETEYSQAIRNSNHYWYSQAAKDYLRFCPIFIGTQIQEPILAAEIERAKREEGEAFGRGFVLTPGDLSPIRTASLRARGIVHVKASLAEFVKWLKIKFKDGLSPKDVIAQTTEYSDERILSSITPDELEVARSLKPISVGGIKSALDHIQPAQASRAARQYLRGFPPSWEIAASNVPVWLKATNGLYEHIDKSVAAGKQLVVITGQAGSGKTTAVMQCLLKYIEENPDALLYQVTSEVKSIRDVFRLLEKLHQDKRCLVYMGELFLYGDSFSEDIARLSKQPITIVSTARSGEWREHYARYLAPLAEPYQFQRFVSADYVPLIDRLIRYVPSPSFLQLKKHEQIQKLAGSKNQLLIALREATESENFDDVITHEFENLPDPDTRRLFMIVGLSTIARVGIAIEMAEEVYKYKISSRSFNNALSALDGIVTTSEGTRLYARHELYVRHIVDNVATFEEFLDAAKGILRAFTKYEIPIIRTVNRREMHLFKSLLNHNFLYSVARQHRKVALARELYEEFEVEFQLDGQFWLQYALYMEKLDQLDFAKALLDKSIKAYPSNEFAIHALADLKLRLARTRNLYDNATKALIDEAVETLLRQDAGGIISNDVYPMVTLSLGHIGALVRHGDLSVANKVARQYFDRLQQIEREIPTEHISKAKERVFRFVTLKEWGERPLMQLRDTPHRPSMRRRR
jgi:hypothetical protein